MVRTLLTFMCFTLFIGCNDSAAPISTESVSPELSYQQRLAKLKYQRDKLLLTISRLEKERTAIIARIRGHGIGSTDDLKSHPEWTIHARELKQVISSIRQLQLKISSFDAAIVRIESILRRPYVEPGISSWFGPAFFRVRRHVFSA